jgi:hypothetical protein
VNIGGVTTDKFAYITDFILSHSRFFHLHVIFISETHMREHSMMGTLCRAIGARWIGVNRPSQDGRHAGPHGGGIGFIVLDKQLDVRVLQSDPKGALAVSVSRRGMRPICMIGVYNPPRTSTTNTRGAGYSVEILDSVSDMYRQFARRHDTTLIIGDLNMRMGTVSKLHYTLDADANTDSRRYRLHSLCRELHVLPLHGRPTCVAASDMTGTWDLKGGAAPAGTAPAHCTSRALSSGTSGPWVSEVDYILTDAYTPMSRFKLGPVQHASLPDPPSTHLALAVQIRLSTAEAVPPPPTAQRPRAPQADYHDTGFWRHAGRAVQNSLELLLARGEPSDIAAHAAQIETAVINGMHAAKAATQRPKRSVRRTYRGLTLTPQVEELFDAARTARTAALRASQTVKRQRRTTGTCTFEELTAADELLATSQAANMAARKAADQYVRTRVSEFLRELERKRVANPHQLHVALRRIMSDSPVIHAPRAALPAEAAAAFPSFFQGLYTEKRGADQIPGISSNASAWHDDIPKTSAAQQAQFNGMLTDPIDAFEVMMCLFPVQEEWADYLPIRGHTGCTVCALHCQQMQEWDRDNPDSPMPDFGGHVWGGKAPGSAGITSEMLRWLRPDESHGGSLFQWRWNICSALARLFNRCLETGKVPTDSTFNESALTPILKKSTPGHTVDPASPDDYRGIATGNIIPKLLGLVILRRLSHWCISTGIIPPNQAGFMPYNSAEFHVFTALETLRHRARCKQDTYLLFLDLKKAYDSVHQEALWHILATMGVPTRLVDFLREWNRHRVTRVTINGALSGAFPVSKGLAQGDVLSPLLFNLYITVLMNRLRRLRGYAGVTWQGVVEGPNIRDLWYADDMLAFGHSAPQIQTVLDTIHEWSRDWGIDVGTGTGKTNVMFVPAAPGTVAPTEPLHIGTTAVPWVTEYKYLGYNLRTDLGNKGFLPAIRARMQRMLGMLLLRNRIVRSLSVTLQLQLTHSMILGCANYLLGVIPFTVAAQVASLDVPMRAAARVILGGHPSWANPQILAADSRFLPMAAVIAQHRTRFGQYLQLTPSRSAPAVAVMKALEGLRGTPLGTGRGVHQSWVSVTNRIHDDMHLYTGTRPQAAASVWDIHRVTAVAGRRYGYMLSRARDAALVDRVAAQPPDTSTPSAHAMSLLLIGRLDDPGCNQRSQRIAAVLGKHAFATPMSGWGAGGDGSVLALADRVNTARARIITRSRYGSLGMTLWPFALPGEFLYRRQPQDTDNRVLNTGGFPICPTTLAEWKASRRSCRLCGPLGDDGGEDIWHLLTSCTHPHVTSERAKIFEAAGGLLRAMCTTLLKSHQRITHDIPAAYRAAHGDVITLVDQGHPKTGTMDGHFATYRLLLCAPFSTYDVRQSARATRGVVRRADISGPPISDAGQMPLSHALGRLLDATLLPRARRRGTANMWGNWAYKHLLMLAGIHSCARQCVRPDVPCTCGRGGDGGDTDGAAEIRGGELNTFDDVNEMVEEIEFGETDDGSAALWAVD